MKYILSCKNLSKSYGRGKGRVQAVRDVNLCLEKAKFYCIIGKSGSGKSTLLRLLSGMEAPDEGSVQMGESILSGMDEKSLAAVRRRQSGFVFQDFKLLPEYTVEENICLPVLLNGWETDKEWMETVLGALSLLHLRDCYPDQFSGGERQRTAIGRALIHRPDVLFADEPTGNLDKQTSESIIRFLLDIHKRYRQTVLLVTHDMDVARCADEILLMEDGKLRFAMKAGEDL